MKYLKFVRLRDLVPRIVELFYKKNGGACGYSWASFGKDCVAGVIVAIVAMPLAMAFSIAAGGTPVQGLYTAIIAGFCVSALGGSRYQIAGPTGAFVVIIYGIIARQGMAGLIAATIIAGAMLIAMGLFGLGKFIKYIPYPVTTGFTTGIGLLIFSQQIKDFFGLNIAEHSPEFIEKWMQHFGAARTIDIATMSVGLCTIAIIVILRRFAPRVPGAAVGVLTLTVICHFFRLPVMTIGGAFGDIKAALPSLDFPAISFSMVRDVFPDAFSIALLAAIESLLSAVVADSMTGDRHNSNTELVAQGVGNIASVIFGGIPATGAIARTATNIKSSAVSPVSGIVHSIMLVLFIMFLAPAASKIPLACLSAVLMVVSWDMSNLGRFIRIIKTAPKSDVSVLLTTFTLTVLVDLTFAVEIGVLLAVFLFIRRMVEITDIKPQNNDIIAAMAMGDIEKNTERNIKALFRKDIEIYEIAGPFFFGVADMLQNTLLSLAKAPKTVILRMRAVPAIDSTGIAALESFLMNCRRRKIRLIITEVCPQPEIALEKSGFVNDCGRENFIDTLEEAIEASGVSENTLKN
ncbi:MAG: STAS domain-containing protein [Spirochaetaceae bacterium]|jgi:SulP family sulfate permease|nr:STAS domain-containing protein [Spirochaetaceae bacterium]